MSKKKNPIKCTFFGFTMAETKRNKIIRFLKKNNYDFEETYDYNITKVSQVKIHKRDLT